MVSPAIDQADDHRPHRWQCPVIMKTAPDFIAYTCSQCGAIGVVGGHEPLSQLRVWAPASNDRGAAPLECIPRRELADDEVEAFSPARQTPARSVRPT